MALVSGFGKKRDMLRTLTRLEKFNMENLIAEDVHIEYSSTKEGQLVCDVETRGEQGMLRYRHIFPKGISESDAKDQILQGLRNRGESILHPGRGRPGRPKKQNKNEVS